MIPNQNDTKSETNPEKEAKIARIDETMIECCLNDRYPQTWTMASSRVQEQNMAKSEYDTLWLTTQFTPAVPVLYEIDFAAALFVCAACGSITKRQVTQSNYIVEQFSTNFFRLRTEPQLRFQGDWRYGDEPANVRFTVEFVACFDCSDYIKSHDREVFQYLTARGSGSSDRYMANDPRDLHYPFYAGVERVVLPLIVYSDARPKESLDEYGVFRCYYPSVLRPIWNALFRAIVQVGKYEEGRR